MVRSTVKTKLDSAQQPTGLEMGSGWDSTVSTPLGRERVGGWEGAAVRMGRRWREISPSGAQVGLRATLGAVLPQSACYSGEGATVALALCSTCSLRPRSSGAKGSQA